MDNYAAVRDYANMEMKDLIESIIRDSMMAGSINYPLRTNGYHACANVALTDRF